MATAAATPMWKHTSITELRKGNSLADFEKMALQRIRDPDVRREVYLVISMLSLAQWNASAIAQNKSPYFIQLVWLLSSFVNSTRERGARPRIICAP